MPYNLAIFSFIETRLFTKLVTEYLSDAEYSKLQQALVDEPESGALIRGTGGVRKLRRAAPGRGRRGGYRVIYYLARPRGIVWILTMYPKNVADSIPANVLKQIKEELENG